MFDNLIRAALHPAGHAQLPSTQMAEAHAMLRLLEEHFALGVWRLELPAGEMFWSPHAFAVHGLPARQGPLSFAAALEAYVPGDRKRAAELFRNAIRQGLGFDYALRVETKSGLRVIDCVADIERGPEGNVRALFGTVRDITTRVATEALAAARSSMMQSLMRNVPCAIAIVDRNMNYMAVSDYWVSGHSHDSATALIGKNHYAVRPELTEAHKLEHQRVLRGETVKSPRAFLTDHSGHPIPQTCVMSPWYGADGEIGGMMMMLGTVDELNVYVGEYEDDSALPTRQEFLAILAEIR